MPRKPQTSPDPAPSDYATIKLTHHAAIRERGALLRRPGGREGKPECYAVGHAWTEDPGREGGTICLVCQVVRWP